MATQRRSEATSVPDECRQFGTIESVRSGDEDGRWRTAWVFVNFGGSVQGFGGYVLNEHLSAWEAELCKLFGVAKFDELVGKHCWSLRCFDIWNEPIEGLEAQDGQRFTATGFFRRHLGPKVESALEKRRSSHLGTIASLTRRVNDETARLANLDASFVDWEVRHDR